MRKILLGLFLIVICGVSIPPRDSIVNGHRKPNLGVYLAEGSASFFVGNIAGVGVPVLLANLIPLNDDPTVGYFPSLSYFLLYPVIYPFASALAINLTAKIFKCPGSFWGAVGGGLLGIGLGIGSCILLRDESTQIYGWSLMAILPPLCATTSYNLFKRENSSDSNSFFHNNININLTGQLCNYGKITTVSELPKVSIKILEIKI